MIFSAEPDKIYHVTLSNKISIAQMMRTFQKFMVTMDTQPFKTAVNARSDIRTLTAPTALRNRGTVFSEPELTLYGNGDITLTINETAFPLYGVTDFLTIDSARMEVFRGAENCSSSLGGAAFPRLEVGENRISWMGNVEKIVIDPKWRWL